MKNNRNYLLLLSLLLVSGCAAGPSSSLAPSTGSSSQSATSSEAPSSVSSSSSASSSSSSSSSSSAVTPVDEKAIDVYFIAGQSNAAGCSDFYRNDKKTLNLSEKYAKKAQKYIDGFDSVYYYGYSYGTSKTGTIVSDDIVPVKVGYGVTKGREIGAELGMAEYLAERYEGTDRKALIIKYAACSSGILSNTNCDFAEWSAPSYPNPNIGTQENLFDNMCGTEASNYSDGVIYQALNKARAKGFNKFNYKGFYWSQGEGDLGKTNYGEAFTALMGDFRTSIDNVSTSLKETYSELSFTNANTVPFLISEICATFSTATRNEDNTSSNVNINSIVDNQRNVAKNDVNTETLTTYMYDIVENSSGVASSTADGISYCGDKWHYNGDDMIEIGNRVASVFHTFTVGQGKCHHEFGEYSHVDGMHLRTCSKCNDYEKDEYTTVFGSDTQYHWYRCEECDVDLTKEAHSVDTLNVTQAKDYVYGDLLDDNGFSVTSSCKCGANESAVTDYEVEFNGATANFDSTAKVSYGGLEQTINLNVSDMNLGDYIIAAQGKSLTPSISKGEAYRNFATFTTAAKPSYVGDTGLTSTNSTTSWKTPKGGVSDGEYIYHIINGDSASRANDCIGIIVKIDVKTGEVVDTTDHAYLWGTNARLNIVNDQLVVTETKGNSGSGTYETNYKSLKGVNLLFDKDLNILDDNYDLGLTESYLRNVYSNNAGTKIATAEKNEDSTYSLKIYEKNNEDKYALTFTESSNLNKCTSNTEASLQQLYCDDQYIYVLYTHTSTKTSHINNGAIRVFDWDGNEIADILIKNSVLLNTNYQGLFFYNGHWYYSNSGWNTNAGLGIFRINLDYTGF